MKVGDFVQLPNGHPARINGLDKKWVTVRYNCGNYTFLRSQVKAVKHVVHSR